MFNDAVSFSGDTRVEVITVLANCGRDTDRARRALVTWIRHKQDKGRSTEHILVKLRDIESKACPSSMLEPRSQLTSSKFIKDTSLYSAFRDARAETFLPRAPDLPLPPSIRTVSQGQTPESTPSLSPSNAAPHYSSSLFAENATQQSSPPISPLRLSQDSSQMSEIPLGKPNPGRPRSAPHIPQSRTPRIQIPRNRSSQPTSSSPITSSLEDSGFHHRHYPMIRSIKLSSQALSQVSPPLIISPDFPSPPTFSGNRKSDHGPSCDLVPPVHPPSIQIPTSRPRRSFPRSSASFSEESNLHSSLRSSVSPSCRLVTPPTTSPPDAPLPPTPSDEQDVESTGGRSKQSRLAEQPPTPALSYPMLASTPARPLPIQPVPSPEPSLNGSTYTDTIGGNSLRREWHEPNSELLSNDVVRQDSPVYEFDEDQASPTAPPPYVDEFETFAASDTPAIDEMLERAINVCGGSPEVRLEVSKCIKFHRGYEPPYWQTRLQACGLNAEAAKYLVDEMSNHVDWAASFGRAF